ncbi:MAG: hypothetical protein IKZ67_04065, partial [Paludibacteraceae bacterium]|nr:hypothetical protein [Paludibacteraceae bacterium]
YRIYTEEKTQNEAYEEPLNRSDVFKIVFYHAYAKRIGTESPRCRISSIRSIPPWRRIALGMGK